MCFVYSQLLTYSCPPLYVLRWSPHRSYSLSNYILHVVWGAKKYFYVLNLWDSGYHSITYSIIYRMSTLILPTFLRILRIIQHKPYLLLAFPNCQHRIMFSWAHYVGCYFYICIMATETELVVSPLLFPTSL